MKKMYCPRHATPRHATPRHATPRHATHTFLLPFLNSNRNNTGVVLAPVPDRGMPVGGGEKKPQFGGGDSGVGGGRKEPKFGGGGLGEPPRANIRFIALVLLLVLSAAPARAADIVTGLVGHWRFDETSGTTAGDASSRGNIGTLSSPAPSWVNGKIQGALSFNGTNNYVNAGQKTSLDITGSFTIAVWGNFTNTTSYGFIVSKSAGGNKGYELFRNIGAGTFRFSVANATGNATDPYFDITTPASYNDGHWHYVVGVYDKGIKAYIYVDGLLVKTSANNPSADVLITTSNLFLGGRGSSGDLCYNGILDDVRIYNRALTAADVLALYNNGGPTRIRHAVIRRAVIR